MSDVMLFGVLRMPYEMAMGDELSRRQYHGRGIESADTIEAQAEHIRVLREALDVARNGLAWYIDMHPDEADDSDAETMAQIDAALEATK